MEITRNTLDIVSRIYDTVIDPKNWVDTLDQISTAVGGTAANILTADYRFSEIRLNGVSSLFNSAADIQTYYELSSDADEEIVRRLPEYPVAKFFTGEEVSEGIAPYAEIVTVKWLKDRFGIFHRNLARLNDNGAWLDLISIYFPDGRGPMSENEIEMGQIFLPHLAKAIELTRPFMLLKARFQAVLAALDRFHIGVFLLSEQGSIIIKNAEADRIIDLHDGLCVGLQDRLKVKVESEQQLLDRAIQDAVATSNADGTSHGTKTSVYRPSGIDPFLLQVSPLRERGEELGVKLRGAIVFVIDPKNSGVVSTDGMETLFGLTSAEAEVCRLLVEGYSTNDMADIRKVSLETIRKQIRSVLTKTRSGRRADVVRLALTINLPIDQPNQK